MQTEAQATAEATADTVAEPEAQTSADGGADGSADTGGDDGRLRGADDGADGGGYGGAGGGGASTERAVGFGRAGDRLCGTLLFPLEGVQGHIDDPSLTRHEADTARTQASITAGKDPRAQHNQIHTERPQPRRRVSHG